MRHTSPGSDCIVDGECTADLWMKDVRVSTPEMFAKFAKFANFTLIAVLTRGIPLPLGVIGHEGSTVIVVLNGLRLLKTRDGMVATRYASQ